MLTGYFKKNGYTVLFLCPIILAGIYLRFNGLGTWPLAVDEYYIVKSVENILTYGLPQFPYGGYYDRGILYQYLTAGLFLLGIKTELAARLIPVITNIAAIAPLYLLTKKIGGRFIAAVVVFAYCFSLWEIEFARFARMYSPFQLISLTYFYFLYKNFYEDDERSLKWLYILSFTSILIYEASIFLAVLNFLPAAWSKQNKTFDLSLVWKRHENLKMFLAASVILAAAFIYFSIGFRLLGNQSTLPPDIEPGMLTVAGEEQIRIPIFFSAEFPSNGLWALLFIIPFSFAVYTVVRIFRDRETQLKLGVSVAVLIMISLLNLFGLSIILLIVLLLIDWIDKNKLKKIYKIPLLSLSVTFLYYSAFAVSTESWQVHFPKYNITGVSDSLKVAWKEFINYPYLYETFVLFRDTIPYAAVVTIVLLSAGLYVVIKDDVKKYKFVYFLLIFLLLLINFLNLTYFKTRYFFLLFPLVLLLELSSVMFFSEKIIRNIKMRTAALIFFLGLIFFISEDYHAEHLLNLNTKRFNFRQGMTFRLKDHYYPRWDVRTPARVVNRNLKKRDIVVADQQISEYYLKRLDYIYKDYRSNDFPGESIMQGKRERWTGSRLIYRNTDFVKFLQTGPAVKWVIINTIYGKKLLEEVSFYDHFGKYKFYSNPDTSVIVFKIPPNP